MNEYNYIYERYKKIKHGKLPEANIQAELYTTLKTNGIFSVLEFKHNGCRFDCAVFDSNNKMICVVEVKSYKCLGTHNDNTKQINKYKNIIDVPVFLIGRLEEIPMITNIILKYIL